MIREVNSLGAPDALAARKPTQPGDKSSQSGLVLVIWGPCTCSSQVASLKVKTFSCSFVSARLVSHLRSLRSAYKCVRSLDHGQMMTFEHQIGCQGQERASPTFVEAWAGSRLTWNIDNKQRSSFRWQLHLKQVRCRLESPNSAASTVIGHILQIRLSPAGICIVSSTRNGYDRRPTEKLGNITTYLTDQWWSMFAVPTTL